MHDIDDLIADHEEEISKGAVQAPPVDNSDLYPKASKVEVGEVERFFDKVSVAAIHLTGDLKIGDKIEIEDEIEPITVEVSSMQIERKEVAFASAGDSIGIKVERPVKSGMKVYLL
jgi:translation elongation factor EF-1alpha